MDFQLLETFKYSNNLNSDMPPFDRVKNFGDYAKKGHKLSWNKGTKGIMKPNKTSFKKGQISWNKGKSMSNESKRKLALSKFKIVIPKDIIYDLYHNQQLSFAKIAEIYDVKINTVSRLYKFYGFKSRSLKESQLIRYENIKKGTIDKDGYKQIHINGKKVREHRYVMEQHLGGELLPTEPVHHINGIKTDNRIENLELFDGHSKHSKFHHKRRLDDGCN